MIFDEFMAFTTLLFFCWFRGEIIVQDFKIKKRRWLVRIITYICIFFLYLLVRPWIFRGF